ncbi:MAG TPA: epoxide hydrolase [Methylomirabilota bacterium]|jgi:microsomal epoxide hydrolase|nr:epoxide hydrolase [Methylomirabilota bacterium]
MASAPATLERFTIDTPQAALDDLRERLRRTRLPGQPRGAPWSYGSDLAYMNRLVRYWRDEYDWRAVEARLNRLPQFVARVGGQRIHLVHERGSGAHPLPLVITHGWPGSFIEFEDVIGPLAHPERFGGRIEDAFDVVVPSLPGYAWSSPPPEPITTRDVARLWDELMTGTLGYPHYVAQGGDWGSLVTSWLGVDFATHVRAIHINMMGLRPYMGEGSAPPSAEEAAWIARARDRLRRETGYQAIQGTKPQTLAYALTDSPVGLAAWIAEKFHGWTDPDAPEPPFAMDQILTHVMIYWLTGCVSSSTWLYTAARRKGDMALAKDELVAVPTAFLACPNDLFPPPPEPWVRRAYNCVRRTDAPAGGHFAAYERPREFVDDVRAFFRDFRA